MGSGHGAWGYLGWSRRIALQLRLVAWRALRRQRRGLAPPLRVGVGCICCWPCARFEFQKNGGPEVLSCEDVAVPELKADEVVFRVEAAGIMCLDEVERSVADAETLLRGSGQAFD